MKTLFISLLFAFIFASCSNKTPVNVHQNKNIEINKDKKVLFLEVQNSSAENLKIKQRLKEELINKNYAISSKLYEVDYYIFINIISSNISNKKVAKKNMLSNINLNIGLGKMLGSNAAIGTNVGTSLGNIFNEEDAEVLQVIVELNIDEYKNNELIKSKDNQIVLSALLSDNKEILLSDMKEKLIEEIISIF